MILLRGLHLALLGVASQDSFYLKTSACEETNYACSQEMHHQDVDFLCHQGCYRC